MRFLLISILFICQCHIGKQSQVLLRKNNPMPNEVRAISNEEARQITTVANGKFRDASIHIGSENSIVMRNFQRGIDAFVVVNISALPSKDMLNTNLEDFDLEKHEFIEVIGESKGCQTGVTLYVPAGKGDNKSYIPVSFTFSRNSFYDDLRKKMEEEKIIALFDSRLDKERESYVFGFFRRECTRFRSIGIREKS